MTAFLTTPLGATIAYDTFGADEAQPMVLIQGFSAQRLGWHPGFCALLAEAGFRVIRFDNRDVGESQRYPAGVYTQAEMAGDTADLIRGLGYDSAHVVGQSMGGMVAQFLVHEHPSMVRSLGLIYSMGSVSHIHGAETFLDNMSDRMPVDRDAYARYYVATQRACVSPGYEQDTAWLTELGGQMYDAGYDPGGLRRQVEAVLPMVDLFEWDRVITVPTTIFAGDSDLMVSGVAAAQLHEAIAGSELTVFPGMGHELPRALWPEFVALLAANAALAE